MDEGRLADYLTAQSATPVEIREVRRLTVGHSRAMFVVDASIGRLVVRMEQGGVFGTLWDYVDETLQSLYRLLDGSLFTARLMDAGIDRATARALCVIAPTLMKSTPASAMARTVERFTPPLASVFARPATRATAERSWSVVMLSSRMMSAPASAAWVTCSKVSASTSTLSCG